ncbi:MAG TPA: hypothetical protein VKE70_30950 [Candidatus Solibacter sp.]|nr:hypothetical protein [Candidatus Solibacter sp.]
MRKILKLLVIAIQGCCAVAYAQETVKGGMVVLGPLRSNGGAASVDFTSSNGTSPVKTGALAARPGTCTVGQMYFASDAAAGQNLSYCTSSNIWTVPVGKSGPCQLASSLGFLLNGTDETTLLNNTVAAMVNAGGGCLAIDGGKTIRADGQIVTPTGGQYATVRITSAAHAAGGGVGDPVPFVTGGGMLDLRYHASAVYGGGPKIFTNFAGNLLLDDITITTNAGASDCAAFLMTTNAVLYINRVTFSGGKTSGASCNDAIIMGGTTTSSDFTMTGYFNGYGSVVRDSRFLNMARVGVLQSSANGTVWDSNYVQGGNITTPVSTIFDIPGAGINARMNQFTNNLLEFGNFATGMNTHMYTCGFRLGQAVNNSFRGNQFWDGDGNTHAFCSSDANNNKQNTIDKSNSLDGTGITLTDSAWPANNYMPYRSIPFFFDGGGNALAGTTTRCAPIGFGGLINKFTMASDQAGSARITVKTIDLNNYTGPNSAADISNGGEFMSGALVKQDSMLTGWNKTLTPNTMVCFTLSSPTNITWLGGSVQVWEGM